MESIQPGGDQSSMSTTNPKADRDDAARLAPAMSKKKRKTNTAADVRRTFDRLKTKLGRTPRSTEIAAELKAKVTPARVRQIIASEGLPTYNLPPNRVDLEREIPASLTPLQRRIAINLRRLYRGQLELSEPRTDAQLAVAFGYKNEPRKGAVEFRRYLHGDRAVSTIDMVQRFGDVFGVDPAELLAEVAR